MMEGVPYAETPHRSAPNGRPLLILLGGASGSGKTYLAHRYGRPHLRLDDFYREASEDSVSPLPRTPYGQIDWDHPDSWNHLAALAGVEELRDTGVTQTPDYSLSASAVVGRREVRCTGGPIVAEGIFAAVTLTELRRAGIPVDAYYVDRPRTLNALLRFVRDVREHRKPVPFLLRRGFALFRADPRVRRAHLEAGFVPLPKKVIARRLAAAVRAAA